MSLRRWDCFRSWQDCLPDKINSWLHPYLEFRIIVKMSADSQVHRIVYFSTATSAMTESDLEDLLVKAREKNLRLNVTGTLVYEHGHFFQVLEGERSVVRELFDVIKLDHRHGNVRLLIEDTLDARQFGEWSMAWSKLSDESLLSTFVEISKTAGVSPASVMISPDLAMIRRFIGVLNGFL